MKTRWLVTGASGQLGGHILAHLRQHHPEDGLLALAGQQPVAPADLMVARIPLTEPAKLTAAVAEFKPTHIVHTAALTAVGACFEDPDLARRCNVVATEHLVDAASKVAARLVFTSTDMVFRGDAAPYAENATPDAESIYGQSKIAAEQVLSGLPGVCVVRIPLLFGLPTTDRPSTFRNQLNSLRQGEVMNMFHDEYRTPVSLRQTARVLIELARGEGEGLLHLVGARRMSRLDLIQAAAQLLQADTSNIRSVSRLSIDSREPRPGDLSLKGTRLSELLPDFQAEAMQEQDLRE